MRILAHRRLRGRLDAHLDGELSAGDAADVTRHLGECPDCARHAVALARIKVALRSLAGRR